MNEKNILKKAMENTNTRQFDLAMKLWYKTQSAVSSKLSGNSMRVDTFVKFLKAMDYSVIVVSDDGKYEYKVGDED